MALEPPAPRLRSELARRFGLTVGLDEVSRAIGAEISYYRAHLNEGRDRESVDELRSRCAAVLADALGVEYPLTDALLASLSFVAFDDASVALRGLRSRGVRLVVVSNWDWSLHEVLERVGLAPLLDGVVTSAEVGFRKPAREVFERALTVAGVPAGRAMHIGDTFDEDVLGARAAGIEAVLIRRGAGTVDADVRTVATLAELIA